MKKRKNIEFLIPGLTDGDSNSESSSDEETQIEDGQDDSDDKNLEDEGLQREYIKLFKERVDRRKDQAIDRDGRIIAITSVKDGSHREGNTR